ENIPLVAPESAGRRGPIPELARFGNIWKETEALLDILIEEHGRGRPWADMAIIHRHQQDGYRLARALAKCDIPYAQSNHRGKRELFAHGDTVKLVTMHSSKGLEFPLVIIPDLGALPES